VYHCLPAETVQNRFPVTVFQPRTYRKQFNSERFDSFIVTHKETDLWIGVNAGSYKQGMEAVVLGKVVELRERLDQYIRQEPEFAKSLKPFKPGKQAPPEAAEMAKVASKAGIGPMSAVAGLFAQEVGKVLLQNFQVGELVVENGGDIFIKLKNDLSLSVYAGSSPLSEKIGVVIPAVQTPLGVCTSSGTVGPSLSFGKADAVMVACKSASLADAFATALGNKIQSPDDIGKVVKSADKYPAILSLIIICNDKAGIKGNFEVKILK